MAATCSPRPPPGSPPAARSPTSASRSTIGWRLWPARPSPGEARILNIDRFGNVVTGLSHRRSPAGASVEVGEEVIERRAHTYGEAPKGKPFLLVGSAGYWEISLRQGSAAAELGVRIGDFVRLVR